jgi:hypothetical protein
LNLRFGFSVQDNRDPFDQLDWRPASSDQKIKKSKNRFANQFLGPVFVLGAIAIKVRSASESTNNRNGLLPDAEFGGRRENRRRSKNEQHESSSLAFAKTHRPKSICRKKTNHFSGQQMDLKIRSMRECQFDFHLSQRP